MDFLTASTQAAAERRRRALARSTPRGKDVVVIGGGDTGTDCVGTSMRQGCTSLVQIEILPKPPMDRADGQSVAGVAQGLQAGLRPGRSRREVRRRSARLSRRPSRRFVGDAAGQARRRRHRRDRNGSKNDKGQFVPVESARHREGRIPRSSCCSPWASSGPSRRCSRISSVDMRRAQQREGRVRQVRDQRARACSPRATAAAARAWSSGPSTKAAAPRASATAT